MVIAKLECLCAIFCFITLCHFYHLNISSEKGGGGGEGGGNVRVKISSVKRQSRHLTRIFVMGDFFAYLSAEINGSNILT